MSDVIIVAAIAAVPATLAAVLGIFNRSTIKDVKTNVDGNLQEIKNQLAIMTAHYQVLTEEANMAIGVKEEKERGRVAGDAKFAEGVESERERERLRQETPR